MSRGRAYTRHQARKHKERARWVVRQWRGDELDPRVVGRTAAVHGSFCSSSACCGNARAVEGATWQERVAAMREDEQRDE
jgi:hypothetical protein